MFGFAYEKLHRSQNLIYRRHYNNDAATDSATSWRNDVRFVALCFQCVVIRDVSVQCRVMTCTCKRMNCWSISSIFEDEIADKITISTRIGACVFFGVKISYECFLGLGNARDRRSSAFPKPRKHEYDIFTPKNTRMRFSAYHMPWSVLKLWFYRQFHLRKSMKWTSNSSACRCTSWRGVVRWRHGLPRIENIVQRTSRHYVMTSRYLLRRHCYNVVGISQFWHLCCFSYAKPNVAVLTEWCIPYLAFPNM